MTIYDFDLLPDRRSTNSGKWRQHPQDVLPMWVADMDFVSPQPVIDALQDFVARGVFGYPEFNEDLADSPSVRKAVVERLERKYSFIGGRRILHHGLG